MPAFLLPVLLFMNTRKFKKFIVAVVDEYAKSTDNKVDDNLAIALRHALLDN